MFLGKPVNLLKTVTHICKTRRLQLFGKLQTTDCRSASPEREKRSLGSYAPPTLWKHHVGNRNCWGTLEGSSTLHYEWNLSLWLEVTLQAFHVGHHPFNDMQKVGRAAMVTTVPDVDYIFNLMDFKYFVWFHRCYAERRPEFSFTVDVIFLKPTTSLCT